MDHSALHPLILQLLDHPEHNAPASPGPSQVDSHSAAPAADSLAAITVSGAAYHVTSAEVDLVLSQRQDDGDETQAARLILSVRPAQEDAPATIITSIQVAAHVLVRRHRARASRPPEVELILDSDALVAQRDNPMAAAAAAAPQRASLISMPGHHEQPGARSPSPPEAAAAAKQEQQQPSPPPSLPAIYRAYIAAINARSMAQSLPRFCLPTVAHNGRALALAEYRRLMEDAQAAIPDITFGVSDLLVDEGRGLVGARLEFQGTPAGEFAGVRPPVSKRDGDGGREVSFSEIVFYWFECGRIREVISLVDMAAYRVQVRG